MFYTGFWLSYALILIPSTGILDEGAQKVIAIRRSIDILHIRQISRYEGQY